MRLKLTPGHLTPRLASLPLFPTLTKMSPPAAASNVHAFNPAQWDDQRSPCPALNALANHSYIPHSGKDITLLQLNQALMKVYNLSFFLAFGLTLGAVLLNGVGWKFSLSALAEHNKIEHNGSLAHADVVAGQTMAPTKPDPERLASLLKASSDGQTLTLEDFARIRLARDRELLKPLNPLHAEFAAGEIALAIAMFGGQTGKVPLESVRSWFGSDRLPEGWTAPKRVQGLFATRNMAGLVKSTVAKIEKSS